MASVVDEFVGSPSVALLDQCTKDQLLLIAEKYGIEIVDRKLKESVKGSLKAHLLEKRILQPVVGSQSSVSAGTGFSFEQQKELLLLQVQLEKMKQEKDLALEEMKQKTEMVRLEVQNKKLNLIQQGILPGSSDSESPMFQSGTPVASFDIFSNLRLFPKFNDKDPDSFFSLFERIAESRKWPEGDQALMLQCILTGRAQEVYSTLNAEDCEVYK